MGNFRHSVIDLRKTAINVWEFPKEEFREFKYVLLIASISNRLMFIFKVTVLGALLGKQECWEKAACFLGFRSRWFAGKELLLL